MKRLKILALTLAFAVTAASQNPPALENLKKVAAAGDYAGVVVELERISADNPEFFTQNDLDYLLARRLESLGDTAGAMRQFEAVRRRGSIFRPYALWRMASIARFSGNLFLERIYLAELTAFDRDTLLTTSARERLAESYLESGDGDRASQLLEGKLGGTEAIDKPSDQLLRRRSLMLAKAKLMLGDVVAATDLFSKVIDAASDSARPDDLTLAAVEGLDSIDSSAGTSLSDAEHFRRGEIYQFNRAFEAARSHYQTLLDQFPSSPLAGRAIFQIGRGFAQQRNYPDAIKWFERGREQTTEKTLAKDLLLQLASAYTRVGKLREAITRYQTFADLYPDDERAARAQLNIIDALRDEGEDALAIQQAQKIQDRFRGTRDEALALFAEARIYVSRSAWQDAVAALARLDTMPDLGGAQVAGGTTRAETAFLRGFALEQLGRLGEAIDTYLSVSSEASNYYGWRSAGRLRRLSQSAPSEIASRLAELSVELDSREPRVRLAAAEKSLKLSRTDAEQKRGFDLVIQESKKSLASKSLPAVDLPEAFIQTPMSQNAAGNRHRVIAARLAYLGLFDEAAPEYDYALTESRRGEGLRLQSEAARLAAYYLLGNRPDKARALYQPESQNAATERRAARFLYPTPFAADILRYAVPRSIDPRFVLAIIRQESGFRPDVKSAAAARGLMQMIDGTARETALGLSVFTFRNEDLYDPHISIMFGARYLDYLFTLFPNRPDAVAAAYNAGDESVTRWSRRSRLPEADNFTSEITFAQTKEYVWRVMSNFRMYRRFYDERLSLRDAPVPGEP